MRKMAKLVAILMVFTLALQAAEDKYYIVPAENLKITEGQLPERIGWRTFRRNRHQIRALIDAPGEIYLRMHRNFRDRGALALRTAAKLPVSGRIHFPPGRGEDSSSVVKFEIPADVQIAEDPENAFFRIKTQYYENLLDADIPGAAWFRYQANAARKDSGLGKQNDLRRSRRTRRAATGMRDTYAVFTGGRAMSENLQLDEFLRLARESEDPSVDIGDLEGISVAEIEWEPLVEGLKPKKDPLAALIPADQHALFFSTFSNMLTLMDEAAEKGTPVLRLLQPRSENARTRQRYEKQLCLKTDILSRMMGPQLVKSVAFTGADPYLRTGADVAVLFESPSPEALYKAIRGRQKTASQNDPRVKTFKKPFGKIQATGVRSADRSVCSYLAVIRNQVIVTNSPAQLRRIVETSLGERKPLSALPEYTFFRSRYERGSDDETGFLIVTDATIRHWCGPKWRIGASRRTRIAALLSDLQAQHLEKVAANAPGKVVDVEKTPVPKPGEIRLGPNGVRSMRYGTLEFLTPIVELEIDKATKSEAESYRRWREGYQRNFRQFFDPIAVRFTVKPDVIGADVTVMPLIEGSEYRNFIGLTQGAKIVADTADPHKGTLVHFAMSIDKNSDTIKQIGGFGPLQSPQFGTSPLSWLGETFALYAEKTSFWEELKESGDPEDFFEKNFDRLPIVLRAGVSSSMKLTTFLASIKGFIQQSAPGMTIWETRKHKGRSYVRVGPSQQAKNEMPEDAPDDFAVYYAPSGSALILTLNETLLKETLDRQDKRKEQTKETENEPGTESPWLGRNLCLKVDSQMLSLAESLEMNSYRKIMQNRSWGNLIILNEWKRLFPKQNPVEMHQKLWHTRLVCPGGGEYVWNKEHQTMESTVYGHPGQPK
ncbi:MAG: hypothetical protein KGZ25_14340, partial [Planctomycetes bacterium]|nr:hypothetical protein [Planctomycetota bacterium]